MVYGGDVLFLNYHLKRQQIGGLVDLLPKALERHVLTFINPAVSLGPYFGNILAHI